MQLFQKPRGPHVEESYEGKKEVHGEETGTENPSVILLFLK